MEVRNGRAVVDIDPRAGSIVRIRDGVSGRAHIDTAKGGRHDTRLFRVLAPTDEWWACYADSQDQAQVDCVQEAGRIRIEYPDLIAADGYRHILERIGPGGTDGTQQSHTEALLGCDHMRHQ